MRIQRLHGGLLIGEEVKELLDARGAKKGADVLADMRQRQAAAQVLQPFVQVDEFGEKDAVKAIGFFGSEMSVTQIGTPPRFCE